MEFYILMVYSETKETYCGVFGSYESAAKYAENLIDQEIYFSPTPDLPDQWSDSSENYFIDKVPEGYDIKS